LQLGDVTRAEASFVAALDAAEGATVALALAGVTAWVRGDEEVARERFERAVGDGSDFSSSGVATFAVAEARALALVGLGHPEEAATLLREAAASRAQGERSRATLYDVFESGPLGAPAGLAELRAIAMG
jgi:Flp pilus assembly protein TadD